MVVYMTLSVRSRVLCGSRPQHQKDNLIACLLDLLALAVRPVTRKAQAQVYTHEFLYVPVGPVHIHSQKKSRILGYTSLLTLMVAYHTGEFNEKFIRTLYLMFVSICLIDI